MALQPPFHHHENRLKCNRSYIIAIGNMYVVGTKVVAGAVHCLEEVDL